MHSRPVHGVHGTPGQAHACEARRSPPCSLQRRQQDNERSHHAHQFGWPSHCGENEVQNAGYIYVQAMPLHGLGPPMTAADSMHACGVLLTRPLGT